MKFPRSFLSILSSTTLTVSRHFDFFILSHLRFFLFPFHALATFLILPQRAHGPNNFICLTLSFSLEGREWYLRVVAFKFFCIWLFLSIWSFFISSSSSYYSSLDFTQIYCPWYIYIYIFLVGYCYGCLMWLPYGGLPKPKGLLGLSQG